LKEKEEEEKGGRSEKCGTKKRGGTGQKRGESLRQRWFIRGGIQTGEEEKVFPLTVAGKQLQDSSFEFILDREKKRDRDRGRKKQGGKGEIEGLGWFG